MMSTFDGWEADTSGKKGSEDPSYIYVPVIIIDDNYKAPLLHA